MIRESKDLRGVAAWQTVYNGDGQVKTGRCNNLHRIFTKQS